MSDAKLELLREVALNRAMLGWPMRVYAYLLRDLELEEFREVKSLVVGRRLRLDEANARKLLRILVSSGYLEAEGTPGSVLRYRLSRPSTERAVA